MRKNFTYSFLCIAVIAGLSGCASIINGSTQSVEFASRPNGAKLFLDGKEMGVTPQTLDLRRKARRKGDTAGKKEYTVRIEMEGYAPYETKLTRKLNGWFFGNLVFGGLIGIVIDATSGAMYNLSPKRVDGDLTGTTSSTRTDNNGMRIDVVLHADPRWEKIGQLTRLSTR
jgi:uncharacterized protein YceK